MTRSGAASGCARAALVVLAISSAASAGDSPSPPRGAESFQASLRLAPNSRLDLVLAVDREGTGRPGIADHVFVFTPRDPGASLPSPRRLDGVRLDVTDTRLLAWSTEGRLLLDLSVGTPPEPEPAEIARFTGGIALQANRRPGGFGIGIDRLDPEDWAAVSLLRDSPCVSGGAQSAGCGVNREIWGRSRSCMVACGAGFHACCEYGGPSGYCFCRPEASFTVR